VQRFLVQRGAHVRQGQLLAVLENGDLAASVTDRRGSLTQAQAVYDTSINSLPFAFQASIFAQDIDVALRSARLLHAGAVMINDHTAFRTDWMPFAGRRQSGSGTGGIPYAMRDMTQEKMIVFNS